MAVVYEDGGLAEYGGSASTRSISITTPAANELIVVVPTTHRADRGLTSVEDQNGDAFTKVIGSSSTTNGDAEGSMWYKVADGDETSLELAWSGSGRHVVSWVIYSGLATSSPLEDSGEDETNLSTSVASQGTGTATPVTADGVAIYGLTCDVGDNWDGGFASSAGTLRQGPSANLYCGAAIADEIYSSASAKSSTLSTTDAGAFAYGMVAVFKAAGAGSTPRTITTSFGALIQKQGLIASASAGAMLQKQQAASASLDAAIQKAQALTASMGAALQGGVTNTADADALLQKAVTVTASLDAALMANITAGTDADAMLQKAVQVSASLDAILLQLGAISASADAMLQKPVTATASMDSALQKPLLETASLGALLQAGVTGAADLDALLQKRVTLTASMDAVLTAIGSSIRTAQIDALLRREGVTVTTSIGAVLQKARSLSASVDAVLAKAYAVTFGAGSLLQRGVSATAGLNAIITLNGVVLSPAGGGVISCRGASAVNTDRSTSAEMTGRSTTSEIIYRP